LPSRRRNCNLSHGTLLLGRVEGDPTTEDIGAGASAAGTGEVEVVGMGDAGVVGAGAGGVIGVEVGAADVVGTDKVDAVVTGDAGVVGVGVGTVATGGVGTGAIDVVETDDAGVVGAGVMRVVGRCEAGIEEGEPEIGGATQVSEAENVLGTVGAGGLTKKGRSPAERMGVKAAGVPEFPGWSMLAKALSSLFGSFPCISGTSEGS